MVSPRSSTLMIAVAIGCALQPVAAHAHPGHGDTFGGGVQHPWIGLDHLLAMFAVGLLAVRYGGRERWTLPIVFLSAMLAGGAAAWTGAAMPMIEVGLSLSVVVLGLMIALPYQCSRRIAGSLVAGFAFFHGYAHAVEAAPGSLAGYAVGVLAGTALLHAVGICSGIALQRASQSRKLSIAGQLIAASGLVLLFGML